MCGIAGYFGPEPERQESVVRAMTAALAHRGPDADGLWRGPGALLGHRRLKVIDLSDRSAQPMATDDGTLCLTYNGEVYNFKALRTELEALGHRFRSDGDTEVILRGYQQWGDTLPEKLDGMFAFALYDATRDRLLLVRDRLGIKPLCYAVVDGGCFFASELGALMRAPIPKILSEPALEAFFGFQHIPAPLTIYRQARKLPPATMLAVDGAMNVEQSRYWTLPERPAVPKPLDEADALMQLETGLTEAVEKRRVADVPLGAFLSGGVDSSLIAALMARGGRELRTFSIGYPEAEYDETRYAEQVAQRIGATHTRFVVEPDAADRIDELCEYWGEPFGDSSAIPSYYVSEKTREHLTVALSGDGSDEAFFGYHRHTAEMSGRRWLALPGPLRKGLVAALSAIPGPARRVAEAGRPFLEDNGAERALKRMLYFSGGETDRLLTDRIAAACDRSAVAAARQILDGDRGTLPERILDYELSVYLPGVILSKTDSMSMRHSLEVRVPFCDHRLVEQIHLLPFHYKYRNGTGKYLLKKLAEKYVPYDCIYRRKVGFTAPVRLWLQGALGDRLAAALDRGEGRLSAVLRVDRARRLLAEHRSGGRNHARQLWLLLVFALWSERHDWEVAS